MGAHSARDESRLATVLGRGVISIAAGLALVGGGTGMAFAGEASYDKDSSHGYDKDRHDKDDDDKHDGDKHDKHGEHHKKDHHKKDHRGKHHKREYCPPPEPPEKLPIIGDVMPPEHPPMHDECKPPKHGEDDEPHGPYGPGDPFEPYHPDEEP